MLSILVIEDDGNLQSFLLDYFTRRVTGYTVSAASDRGTALARIQDEAPDLLLLDLGIPPRPGAPPDERQGLNLARWVKSHAPGTAVIVVSVSVRHVPDLFGVVDSFFVKTFRDYSMAEPEWERLAARVAVSIGHLASRGPAMQTLRTGLLGLTPSDRVVVFHGEVGVGKRHCARLLHRASRDGGRLEERACAASAGVALVAELPALVATADVGLVLLQGIDGLAPEQQAALAGLLTAYSGAARLVLTASDSPGALHRAGRLTEALWRRLDPQAGALAQVLHVPPLRERTQDLRELARLFRTQAAEAQGLPVPALHPDALDALAEYSWPGNVAQLRRILERAVATTQGQEIRPGNLDVPWPPEYEAAWREKAGAPARHEEVSLRDRFAFRAPGRFELLVGRTSAPAAETETWETLVDGQRVEIANGRVLGLWLMLLERAGEGRRVTQADKPRLFAGDPREAHNKGSDQPRWHRGSHRPGHRHRPG